MYAKSFDFGDAQINQNICFFPIAEVSDSDEEEVNETDAIAQPSLLEKTAYKRTLPPDIPIFAIPTGLSTIHEDATENTQNTSLSTSLTRLFDGFPPTKKRRHYSRPQRNKRKAIQQQNEDKNQSLTPSNSISVSVSRSTTEENTNSSTFDDSTSPNRRPVRVRHRRRSRKREEPTENENKKIQQAAEPTTPITNTPFVQINPLFRNRFVFHHFIIMNRYLSYSNGPRPTTFAWQWTSLPSTSSTTWHKTQSTAPILSKRYVFL